MAPAGKQDLRLAAVSENPRILGGAWRSRREQKFLISFKVQQETNYLICKCHSDSKILQTLAMHMRGLCVVSPVLEAKHGRRIRSPTSSVQ